MTTLEKYSFSVPQAIKQHPTDLGETKHYDQIAFNLRLDDKMVVFDENEQKAGAFNFANTVFTKQDMETYKDYFTKKIKEKNEQALEKYYNTS